MSRLTVTSARRTGASRSDVVSHERGYALLVFDSGNSSHCANANGRFSRSGHHCTEKLFIVARRASAMDYAFASVRRPTDWPADTSTAPGATRCSALIADTP